MSKVQFKIVLQEKTKIHKSVVNQIAKYIKDDPVVSSTVVKVPKISRPKGTPAQSASSTLIRKAMADAHKSLTTKEEQPKVSDYIKRTFESPEGNVGTGRSGTMVSVSLSIVRQFYFYLRLGRILLQKRDVHDVKHKPAISNKKEQKNLSKNKIEAG